MKRVLSFVISFVLFVTSLSSGLVAVAETISHESKLDKFANNLFDMIRTYDTANDYSEDAEEPEIEAEADALGQITEHFPIVYPEHMYSAEGVVPENEDVTESEIEDNEPLTKYENLPENAFALNRLIVKSKNKIDYCGAIDYVSGYKDLYILQYDSIESTIAAYEYYLSLDEIEYVEPDLIHHTQETEVEKAIPSDDIEIGTEDYVEILDKIESWNTKEVGFDKIKEKLDKIELKEVVVAVLDSGIDTDHEMFEDRIVANFVNCSTSGAANSIEDDYGHGTHVSGIIVDNTPNSVKIKPYKVLNREGKGALSSIIVALDIAVEDGVDIINMSLTALGESQTMTDSVDAAVEKGINVVVAAGNNGVDLTQKAYTPACVESAITVSAVTKKHTLSSYSNYNGPIDIAAPGDDIVSSYLNNTYVSMSGTSMAAPQVSAAIALVRSVYKEKTNAEVEEFIEKYATAMEEEEGFNRFGAGVLYVKYILESKPRTIEPYFSVESGEFVNTFNLSIKCYEKDSKILYVMIEEEFDGDYEDDEEFEIDFLNGNLYEHSLTISVDTKIAAVAFSKDKLFSSVVVKEYDRKTGCEEDLYDIDSAGMITGYIGTEIDLIIPETIRGQKVKGIGSSAFEDNENIRSVVLPSTATHIGVDSFKNCTSLEAVTGGAITHINLNAFANSTISTFNFEKVKNISDKAFYGCTNLENVNLPNVEKIGASAFENVTSIEELNCEKLTTIGNYAFRGTGVSTVNLPKLTSLGTSAFEKCSNLTSASMPLLKEIPTSAFKNCTALNEIDMPAILSIGNSAFQATALETVNFEKVETIGNYAFRDINTLKYAILPAVKALGTGGFYNCTNLKFIYLPSLEELKTNTFAKCDLLKSAWLPAVEKVNKNAFNNSSIEYVQFDTVKEIESLPNNLYGLVLPTSLTAITATTPNTDFKVYGYEDTYAHQYAIDNSKEFVKVPAIICDTPESVSMDEQYIYTYALGFNCTYQWYKNDVISNENGTLIEGATNFFYEPTRDDNTACYYCVITSDDGENRTQVVTDPVTNIPEYQDADYTEYNSVIEETSHIERNLYTEESLSALDKLLEQDISGYSLAEQDLISQHIEAIKDAISSLMLDYVLGDINADGKISLLDARIALKTVSGTEELNELQTLSADMNEDGKISLIDVRAILRIISEVNEE